MEINDSFEGFLDIEYSVSFYLNFINPVSYDDVSLRFDSIPDESRIIERIIDKFEFDPPQSYRSLIKIIKCQRLADSIC